jgi:excisionase family DNA binding protein
MKRQSDKFKKRFKEAKPIRDALIASVGECENCGRSPGHTRGQWSRLSQLCVHEIANGPHRQKALDKRFATLVLCWGCNGGAFEDKSIWPESRQLALLLQSRPHDFDLESYNFLINPRAPRRIEKHEVVEHIDMEFLSVTEVASRLSVNRRTVQSWITSGKLQAVDAKPEGAVRSLWRVHMWDLAEFLKKRDSLVGPRSDSSDAV